MPNWKSGTPINLVRFQTTINPIRFQSNGPNVSRFGIWMTIFDNFCWQFWQIWQFLINFTIFDNFDFFDNFWRFMTILTIETIFDKWKDSPGDSTSETLSTILTIENLNSDNHSYLTINCDTGQHSQFLRCLELNSVRSPELCFKYCFN